MLPETLSCASNSGTNYHCILLIAANFGRTISSHANATKPLTFSPFRREKSDALFGCRDTISLSLYTARSTLLPRAQDTNRKR